MKRAAIVLGSYFAGGLVLFAISRFLPEDSILRYWSSLLGLIGMSFPVTVLAGLLLSLPHELGHIWTGKRLGFQLYHLHLMGFGWISYRWQVYWTWDFQTLFNGNRSMVKANASIKELRQVLVSGPIASVLMAIVWTPFLFYEQTLAFGIIAVGANLVYGLGSLIPTKQYNNGESMTDGTYLLMSFKQPDLLLKITRRHCEEMAAWLRPSNEQVVEIKLTGNANSDCYQNLVWYWKMMDGGKVEDAEQYVKSALEIARDSEVPETYVVEAAYEAAVYFRRFRPNEELAVIADNVCEKLKPDYDKKRLVEAARLWVSGDKSEAIRIWNDFGKDYLNKNPDLASQVHGRDWFIRLRTEDMVFETHRLYARPWALEDVEAAFDIYRKPEVNRYLGRNPKSLETIEEAQAMLERWVANQAKRPIGQGTWALVRKEDEKILGTIMCKDLPNGDLDPSGEIEIGWHLDPSAWGYGYATEAGLAVAEYGFRTDPNLPRVLAVVYPENVASQNVARKVGMTHLGVSSTYYGIELELFELKHPAEAKSDFE